MPAPVDRFAGAPNWADVLTSEPDTTAPFYCRLFGWTAEDMGPDYGNYVNFYKHNALVAGLAPNSDARRDGWSTYFASDDAEVTAAAITTHGGTVHSLQPVGDQGVMAFASDPVGNEFGLWQAGKHPGFGVVNESGATVWYELHSKDYPTALSFYRDTFGWTTQVLSDSDDFRFSVVTTPGDPVAGIAEASGYLGQHGPLGWLLYFGVSDVDESAELLTRLGGTLLDDPRDSEYGRVVNVTDPTGAQFALIQIVPR